MTDVNRDFSEFIAALNSHRVEYIIVGAFALAHFGFPRATGDIDFWIRPVDKNAAAVLRALQDFGIGALGITVEDILSGKIIQIGVPPIRIDLLTELDGLTAHEIWKGRQKGSFGDQSVFYLGRKQFIKNKRASGRKKDLADLEALGELG